MASLNCFCPSWKKKKNKGGKGHVDLSVKEENLNILHVKLEHQQTSLDATELRSTSFSVPVPFCIARSSRCNVKVMSHGSPDAEEPCEAAYEGEDEHDETLDSKFSFQACSENLVGEKGQNVQDINDGEFNFQVCLEKPNEEKRQTLQEVSSFCSLNVDDDIENSNSEVMLGMNASGHVSDPGTRKARFWASPGLKRSCSSLAIRSASLELEDQLLLSKGKSYEDMQRLAEMRTADILARDGGSPVSIRSRCSADKVILKKHSSSQILPSGSRKLWWKLFLWSHRNLHRPASTKPLVSEVEPTPLNQHGGYSSDTVEPKHTTSSREELSENGNGYTDDKNWNGVYGHSRVWPQNQWFAFPPDSAPLWRVDEWVKGVISQPPCEGEMYDHHSEDDEIPFSSPPEYGASFPKGGHSHLPRPSAANMLEEISHANTVIRSLNSNSTAAHITGLGLAAIPSISPFSSLRSVNLSGNLIVQITPGTLPKGLHALNLSRNKISTIEGLRELTRLRVLDLSYNRISRIGQGLSNCTLIKELYLAGNKISVVEGLHRLLKLAVLGLSFNKITTAKALGQLVANYNTLIAVNLLGNPIQKNVSDELLRKTLCGLLPKPVLLNNQPINPRKARELRADANAKAALGNSSSGLSGRRKAVRKGATQGSSSHSVRRSSVSTGNKSKHRTRSHSHHHSNLKDKA